MAGHKELARQRSGHFRCGDWKAHSVRSAEVKLYYRFHPLHTQSLPVIRLHELHDESYYVVRREDGRPLAVPVWMAHPESACSRIGFHCAYPCIH